MPLDRATSPATNSSATNRHPVDQLAEVREQIRTLQDREKEIRDRILANPDDLAGDEFAARITTSDTATLDRKAIEKAMGEAWLAGFLKRSSVTRITVAERVSNED